MAGAAAAVALIIGGVIGGLIGYNNRGTTPAAAPVTVTADVEPPLPTFAVNVDPVCDEWGVLNDEYRGKRAEWTGTAPTCQPVSGPLSSGRSPSTLSQYSKPTQPNCGI